MIPSKGNAMISPSSHGGSPGRDEMRLHGRNTIKVMTKNIDGRFILLVCYHSIYTLQDGTSVAILGIAQPKRDDRVYLFCAESDKVEDAIESLRNVSSCKSFH